MEQDHIKDLLPEYLEGGLDASDERMIEAHLENCAACNEELRELEVLFTAFKSEKEAEPSASLRTDFEAMLQKEKQEISEEAKTIPIDREKRSTHLSKILKVAAVVSLLLCSYLLGKFHQPEQDTQVVIENDESEDQDQEMLALLNNTSASKRIMGVTYFEDFSSLDEEIIGALIDRMLNDENSNVRLTAVEALSKFTASEEVKKSLITALKTEKDPVIQISIIRTLVKIQEKKAVEPMEHLLEQDSTETFVKEQIRSLLPSIT